MEKKTKTTKVDKVAEAINLLAEAIKGLEGKIDGLKVETPEVPTEEITVPKDDTLSSATSEPYLLPEYRTIINERLNEKFKAKVEYGTQGAFCLYIWVPREYSNASKSHWDLNKEDLRVKWIENALGELGVREWVDKIAENLGHDIILKVAEDSQKVLTN